MKLNLNNVHLKISAGRPDQIPADPIPQIAFSGRSNVGKSSIINTLIGRKSLARVSGSPGKTITINFYDIDRKLFLVDLPGYGFAKRAPADKLKWSQLTDGYFTANKNIDLLRLVVQLVDSRVGPTADDRDMLSFLRQAQIPHIVVATKIDKLNATERNAFIEKIQADPDVADAGCIVLSSAQSGAGRDDLWEEILAYAKLDTK
ncbi:MAG: YihA family ribosome biogenesis GTP-binding protein [Clostridia bacterium]|nr:YihA family ribosome biogenesis GTP-binding protein [Clostridia bacterium]